MHEHAAVICPYCHHPAQFHTDSVAFYGHDYGPVWACIACGAWVGVHRGTRRPLGRLADSTLRSWKRRAHLAFDPLWLNARAAYVEFNPSSSTRAIARTARTRAYLWLGEQLHLTPEQCHIGAFDVEQCRRVIETIEQQKPTAATIRAWAKIYTGDVT